MLIVEVMIPLEEDNKELNGFFKIEFFVLVQLEHFFGDFYEDGILSTVRSEDDFGVAGDDSCFAYFIVVVEHISGFYLQFIKGEDFPAVDMNISFLNTLAHFELIPSGEEAILCYGIDVL